MENGASCNSPRCRGQNPVRSDAIEGAERHGVERVGLCRRFSTRLHSPCWGPIVSDRLTSTQRAHLRSLAHGQDPHIHVGKEGITPAVEQAIEEAFNTRELVTIRVLDNCPRDVRDVAEAIADSLDEVQVVRTIGGTALLYRPHPDDPKIDLPTSGEKG